MDLITSTPTYSQLEDILSFTTDIVENLDDRAIQELTSGSEKDVENIINLMVQEAQSVLTVPSKNLDTTKFEGLDFLTDSLEDTLRRESLNYFLLSTMPDFQLSTHHLEWGNLSQLFKYLVIQAARGHGKCLSPEEKVLMFDGSYKKMKDLVVGDKLMGPDSTPRVVLSTHSGTDQMYKVTQSRGEDYSINSRHTLSLYKVHTTTGDRAANISTNPSLVDMDVQDFLQLSNFKKSQLKGYKVCIDFEEREVSLDPYYVGLWLGDGNSGNAGVTTEDKPIQEYLCEFAKIEGLSVRITNEIEYHLTIPGRGKRSNRVINKLKEYGILNNKRIPEDYLVNSIDCRLKLLAGIVDSDGWVDGNQYQIVMSRKSLILDIQRLVNSLGFRSSYLEGYSTFNGKRYRCYSVHFSGELADKIPVKLERKKPLFNGKSNCISRRPKYVVDSNYNITGVSSLQITPIGEGEYVGITVSGDSRYLLWDNTVIHNSFFFSKGYILWKLYCYMKDTPYRYAPYRYRMCKEGMLITNEYKLANHLLSIVKEEIEENDILREALYPDNRRDGWGAESIVCKNGAKITAKSVGSKMRGFHPHYIVNDDYLNDQVLYSTEQNSKYINHFHSVTMNMIEPGGQVIVVGTPFREDDLYSNLKKSNQWKVFEYPGIYPDGRVLWPERHSLQSLLDKRVTQGSTIFSREILVRPISTESSLFPFPLLRSSFDETLTLVPNIYSCKKKYKKVVLGADFAISANIGADFSVFTVLGVTENDHYDILHIWRKSGSGYDEQVSTIKRLYNDFNPDVVLVEDNGMQKMFVQMLNDKGVPATGQTTTAQKKYDLHKGIPHMSALFEQGRIHIPRGDQNSVDTTDILVSELSNFTWDGDKKKIQGVGSHDDCPMSLWISISATKVGTFNFHFL